MEDKELIVDEEIKEELYTESELLDIVQEFINPVEVDLGNVQGAELDKEQFNAGMREISFVCGIASALKSCGFSNAQVFEYIMAREGLIRDEIME